MVRGSQPPNGHTKTCNAAELCDNNLYSSWQKKKKKKKKKKKNDKKTLKDWMMTLQMN